MALLPFANGSSGGGGSGTVTSVSIVTANGISGSVANPTTTPAITLTLGAITPSSVNSVVLSGSSTPTLAVTGTSSISGANTGDQTITLTSDVTGSGTGSFATTIKSSVALAGNPTTTTQSPADNSTKIATTAYVDNAVLGQNFKEASKYATTAALPAIVYNNGSSGVGATLTAVSFGAITLDGSTPSVGDRVLVKNQVSTFQNGIYTVTIVGTVAAVFVLTRSTDFDQSADIKTGDSTFVTSGSTQSTTTWAYTGIDSPTMGTTALTFAQTAGQGSFTAGNGISITGNSIAIDTSVTVDKTTAQTLTNKTLTTPIISSISNTGTLTLPTSTDTLVGKATTDTFTNKTYDTAGTGNVFKINGTTVSAVTGSGSVVLATSPTLVTPTLGVASATSLNKVTVTTPATGSTLTIVDNKTLTVNNTLTLAGTDSTVMTFPATSDTVVTLATTQTLTNKTITSATNTVSAATFTNPYKYGAYKSSGTQTINTGSQTKITFDVEEFDTGGNFATSTFTAPIAGFYFIGAALGYNAVGSGTRLLPLIFKNGAEVKRGEDRFTNALSGNAMVSAFLQLAANDTIDIYGQPVGANTVIVNVQAQTYTYGFLVSIT